MQKYIQTAEKFALTGNIVNIENFGCGHINTTFLIKTDANREYILQKINTTVFKAPDELMDNMVRVTKHLRNETVKAGGNPEREVLNIIPAQNGSSYIVEDGCAWRMLSFVSDSVTLQTVSSPTDFYYAGKAFGKFTKQLDNFPADTLHETIANFHNTPSRYADFEKAVALNASGRAGEVCNEIEFVRQRRDFCSLFTDKIACGALPLRVTHNDTKLNNVLFDKKTLLPVAVIDLDTVMPGLSLYDFGDAIRFGANPVDEDEKDLSKVCCDLKLFEAFTRGYLEECGSLLTREELDMLPYAGKMMTLECGMRFLADHISGDIYFKIHRNNHNLDRCRTQFKMVADMEEKQAELISIVNKIRNEVLN